MSKFYNAPIIGVDISADFSMVAILAPNGNIHSKPFKVNHDANGFDYLLKIITKVEEEFSMKTTLFMEATGIYHLTLFYFLRDNKVNSFVINPLVTNCNKNKNIRKVKNDKIDAISIAKIGKYEDIKISSWVDPNVYMLRNLCREYYDLVDGRANIKKKLSNDLRVAFPGYEKVFSDITGTTSLAVLTSYSTPETIIKASKEDVVNLIAISSRKGLLWARKAYNKLIAASENALKIGIQSIGFTGKIKRHLNLHKTYTTEINSLLDQIKNILDSNIIPETLKSATKLLSTLPGVGPITAITIACEIGDISQFQKPKQLTAFFGLDPSVSQSGKFNSTENRMSKRGTSIGRRALYVIALSSVRKKSNGAPFNSILLEYYKTNLAGKKKKVALVAIMHKLLKYIFAILKSEKPYEVRDPKIHAKMYLENHSK
ncbi:MAG: IS110 family transposase, partial [Firmicutes bacterium]|nr:IS110 family transposase [Bacillota bacterium]